MTDNTGGMQTGGDPSGTGQRGKGGGGTPAGGSRHRSFRSGLHRRGSRADRIEARRRRHRLLRRLLMVAVAVLALCSAGLLVVWLQARDELREKDAEMRGAAEADERLVKAQEERASALAAQLAELVAGRLPKPLLPLQPDKLIELDGANPLLRNILFTQVGTPDHPGYEYRLTCRNDKSEPLQPRFVILVFSQCGIQIGAADVTRSSDWDRLGTKGLAPGESCSFSGPIEFQFGDDPAYFIVGELPLGEGPPRLAP